MSKTNLWVQWWQKKNATDRFLLMNKHNIKRVSDKLIKRMYTKETIIGTFYCHEENDNDDRCKKQCKYCSEMIKQ